MTSEEKGMVWQDAILKVLEGAGEPLHYNEITRRIGEQGLRQITGATPARTVNSILRSLKNEQKVTQRGSGVYAVPEVAEQLKKRESDEETEAEEAATNPERFAVKAYGLYWSRGLVEWETRRSGRLWGRQFEESLPVDFAKQDGIYFLHKGSEIVYVGQTLTGTDQAGLYARLLFHHTDRRKRDRWDAFSWYGFRPVSDEGTLGDAPSGGNLREIIDAVEAMFIEALMPRLNMRSGDGSKEIRDTGLYIQSGIK